MTELLLALKEKPTTVLLIYLPENQCCLDLVKMYAVFLKEACYVHPYVIDIDVGSQVRKKNYYILILLVNMIFAFAKLVAVGDETF